MPPSRSPDEPVDIHVTTGSPLAEVFLVDHTFALVARAIGDLDRTVPPGVYKVRAKLGDALAEELVIVDSDLRIDLSSRLSVGSAAPLQGTARKREYDMDTAALGSATVEVEAGHGARIFVMARVWGAGAAGSPPPTSLHAQDGTLLAEPQPSPADPQGLAYAVNVEVDPGPYFLRWSDESGVPAEQCVHAVEGWQTQIFVLEDGAEEAELGRTRVSVHMGRKDFNPHEDQLVLAEEARTALAGERRVAADFLNQALPEKFENPMLGLFGAHLMLLARDAERHAREDEPHDDGHPRAPVVFEQSRFDIVVGALRELLGERHPDVVALSTQATGTTLDSLEPIGAPPMLWRSWLLLIAASNAIPKLVPVSTWRRTLKLLPLRPFLLWSPEELAHDSAEDWREGLARALATAKRKPQKRAGGSGPLEAALSSAEAEAAAPGPVEAGEDTRRRVSRELIAPRAAIDEVAGPPSS